MRLLWLLPDLEYTSAARQACLLVPELRIAGHDVRLAVLRSGGPVIPPFLDTIELSTPHDLPLKANIALDGLLREFRPDVLHTWRAPALRALLPVRLGRTRVIACQSNRGGKNRFLDRWAARRIAALEPEMGEAGAIPLAGQARQNPANSELPTNAQLIVSVGRLDREHGIRESIWAYQVLEFFKPNLHLWIIGEGPQRMSMEKFASASPRIKFLGSRPDAAELIAQATLVWAPNHGPGGEQVALEAQAAGVPVVASRTPGLAAVIVENETGLFANVREAVSLAKVSRALLENDGERLRMATNARELADRWPTPAQIAWRWLDHYAHRTSAAPLID